MGIAALNPSYGFNPSQLLAKRRLRSARGASIRAELQRQGLADVSITSAVRTGESGTGERTAMRKRPPHILVTTPEPPVPLEAVMSNEVWERVYDRLAELAELAGQHRTSLVFVNTRTWPSAPAATWPNAWAPTRWPRTTAAWPRSCAWTPSPAAASLPTAAIMRCCWNLKG